MPTPEFVLTLRERIGHDPLWLPGVTAVVFNEEHEVLLGRRADDGRWTLITGMLDPGEEPGPGALREVEEETGVRAELVHLIHVGAHGPVTFPNGDVCSFLNLAFSCRYVSGAARVNDDESTDVGWYALAALPDLSERHRMLIALAQSSNGIPVFEGQGAG
ncbi:NUDIX domain-containing protein [Arthrobacter zhangbolii]|uniref:NUDIX domain-containing protein n=1 Tax=Arthrobacter zhangbolii TaxID=2886936 RepID=A0A9X1M7K0_9MICC|nr:NUDIX domain-containing protein [Arthrobacter zhangbolii]MCC3272913.1 NUDIX domain-containing protein [Arthrobacter zhangbolii]MCC3295247.1 NUDIX domain-containing protein [Arthrobacter zhangbolii]UON92968.1 NUDIX domain-containing protein [Arthrobacter zhangbolii]